MDSSNPSNPVPSTTPPQQGPVGGKSYEMKKPKLWDLLCSLIFIAGLATIPLGFLEEAIIGAYLNPNIILVNAILTSLPIKTGLFIAAAIGLMKMRRWGLIVYAIVMVVNVFMLLTYILFDTSPWDKGSLLGALNLAIGFSALYYFWKNREIFSSRPLVTTSTIEESNIEPHSVFKITKLRIIILFSLLITFILIVFMFLSFFSIKKL